MLIHHLNVQHDNGEGIKMFADVQMFHVNTSTDQTQAVYPSRHFCENIKQKYFLKMYVKKALMYIYEMRYVWLCAFISQVDPIRFLKWNFVDVRMAHDTRGWYIFMICARLHGELRRSQSKPVVTVYLQCVPLQSVSTPAHKFSCHWRCGHFIRFFPPDLLELWTSIWKPYAMNVISKSICIKKVERSWEKNIWHKPNTFASATPPVLLYKYIYVCVGIDAHFKKSSTLIYTLHE